ncbi:MAG: HAD family hydrolase [Clostridia bacterium]|nr:HAD family hydrolase [Clostridia bacterium]
MSELVNKAVIFDLDGTVTDTVADILDAMNQTLTEYGFETITESQMKDNLGGATREIVALSIAKEIDEETLDACTEFYTSKYIGNGSPKTTVFAGVKEVLLELKNRGYKLAVLSNKPLVEMQPIYERIIKPLGFDLVLGVCETVKPKPDPEATLNILKDWGVSPENAYFVGDGETDVVTAVNANIKVVAVLWGNRSREFLSRYGAKVFAEKPEDLLEIIK